MSSSRIIPEGRTRQQSQGERPESEEAAPGAIRSSPRNYNKNLSILRDFFKFQVVRGKLHGDPTLAIERARARQAYRTTFSIDQRRAILASNHDRRDRLALRLLLDYGLRKGALRVIQFKHFDHQRKWLTIFTKGQKVRSLPIPDPDFGGVPSSG